MGSELSRVGVVGMASATRAWLQRGVVTVGLVASALFLSACGSPSVVAPVVAPVTVLNQVESQLADSMVRGIAQAAQSLRVTRPGGVLVADDLLSSAPSTGVSVQVVSTQPGVLTGAGGIVHYQVTIAGQTFDRCVSFPGDAGGSVALQAAC